MLDKNKKEYFYKRLEGMLPRKSGGYLVLYPLKGDKIVLNETANILWQLADGLNSEKVILSQMIALFPNEKEFSIEAVSDGLLELLSLGVIEKMEKPTPANPFIKVGFANFWDGFEQYNNYLLQILQQRYTAFVVDTSYETADILFFGAFPTPNFHHSQVNRAETIKIGVYTKPQEVNPNDFDVALATFENPDNKRILGLPSWVFHFDWRAVDNEIKLVPPAHLKDLNRFSAKAIGDSLFELIEHAPLPTDEELKQTSSTLAFPKLPANYGKITDFSKIKKGELTIGMATYDDFDGVYFTLQSIRFHHPEVLDKLSFIVIDNNPGGEVGQALSDLGNWIKNYQYIPFEEYNSTAVRDLIFRKANTEYVMSVDSHILIKNGGIAHLIDWLDAHPESMDLIQGPLIYDDTTSYSTSFHPMWRGGMYGAWHSDARGANAEGAPFEISMQGLGLFACRKEAWLGFNPRFRGFGGEEGYIHEKFRQKGRKTLCLPSLRWLHRFTRPNGTKYANLWNDRIRNYYLGFQEIGWDVTPMELHFKETVGEEQFNSIRNEVRAEMTNPFIFFDAVFFVYPEGEAEILLKAQAEFQKINIQKMVRLFPIKKEQGTETINYEKAKAAIVDKCVPLGYDHVIIIDNRATLTNDLIGHLKATTQKIKQIDWKALYIGNVENGVVNSSFYKKSYVATTNRPKDSYIAAFNLNHFYELAIAEKIREKKKKIPYNKTSRKTKQITT